VTSKHSKRSFFHFKYNYEGSTNSSLKEFGVVIMKAFVSLNKL